VVCDWIEAEIAESSVQLDAGPVLAAAAKATPIWPEDVGIPEPPDPPRPTPSGYLSTFMGSAPIAISKEDR
jgi:hypothetical protein